MKRITIKEMRQSMEEQIVEMLEERGDFSLKKTAKKMWRLLWFLGSR